MDPQKPNTPGQFILQKGKYINKTAHGAKVPTVETDFNTSRETKILSEIIKKIDTKTLNRVMLSVLELSGVQGREQILHAPMHAESIWNPPEYYAGKEIPSAAIEQRNNNLHFFPLVTARNLFKDSGLVAKLIDKYFGKRFDLGLLYRLQIKKPEFLVRFILIYIHEQFHFNSKTVDDGRYKEMEIGPGKSSETALLEGLNNLIALSAGLSYFKQSNSSFEYKKYFENFVRSTYISYMIAVIKFVKIISEKLGIEFDTALQSLFRAQFHEGSISRILEEYRGNIGEDEYNAIINGIEELKNMSDKNNKQQQNISNAEITELLEVINNQSEKITRLKEKKSD